MADHAPRTSIPFKTTGQIPIPTPPSSSGSNTPPTHHFSHLGSKFVHPARRRGSADSYTSNGDNDHYAPSPSYSIGSPRSNQFHLPSSPGACLIIRGAGSNSNPSPSHSPQVRPRQNSRDFLSSSLPPDLNFDVEPLSPFSYVPRQPPSRKNSRDDREKALKKQQQLLQKQQEEEAHLVQMHMMPKNMIVPLPDRNAEMKYLMDHNKSLTKLIRNGLGEESFALATDLWCHTRRSEISDHEWLRRSRYFLVDRMGADTRLWSEWCMMVGYDHSVDLKKDENGVERNVDEYADRIGHMQCLEEEEE